MWQRIKFEMMLYIGFQILRLVQKCIAYHFDEPLISRLSSFQPNVPGFTMIRDSRSTHFFSSIAIRLLCAIFQKS